MNRRASMKATIGVGYGRPPRKNRFKKSSPAILKAGRKAPLTKRRMPNASTRCFSPKDQRLIEVTTDGSKKSMPTLQAIARSINVNAIKGDPRAQRLAMDMASNAEARRDESKSATSRRL